MEVKNVELILDPLFQEIDYFVRVFSKKVLNEEIAILLDLPLNEIFRELYHTKYDRSVIDLLNHAFYPLIIQIKKIIRSSSFEFSFEEKPFKKIENNSQISDTLTGVSDNIKLITTKITPELLDQYISIENLTEKAFITKFSKVVGHTIQHLGQVILLHGIVSQKLNNSP